MEDVTVVDVNGMTDDNTLAITSAAHEVSSDSVDQLQGVNDDKTVAVAATPSAKN